MEDAARRAEAKGLGRVTSLRESILFGKKIESVALGKPRAQT